MKRSMGLSLREKSVKVERGTSHLRGYEGARRTLRQCEEEQRRKGHPGWWKET